MPSCFVYERSRSLGDDTTVSSWACGTDSTPVMVLATTTTEDNGEAAPTSSGLSFPSSSSSVAGESTLTTRSSLDQAISTDFFGVPQTSPAAPKTTSNPNNPTNGFHLSTALISTIVVVGCGALVVLWFYIRCCCWPRFREKRDQRKRWLMQFNNEGDPAGWGGMSNTNTAQSISPRARLEQWQRHQATLRQQQTNGGFPMSAVGSNRGGGNDPNGSQYGGSTVRDYYG